MISRRSIPVLLAIALISAAVHLSAKRFGDWSEAVSLTSVNTASFEAAPALSKDDSSLYFHSARAGLGFNDIYVSRRGANGEWQPPVRMPWPISSEYNEVGPVLSRDGHSLFFSTNRRDGTDLDIWVSHRRYVHDDSGWGVPAPIDGINLDGANDAGAAYFENEDGRAQLFFQSNRGEVGGTDLYVSEQREDGTWDTPRLVTELSSSSQDNRLTIRHDGREVFFSSNRPGSAGHDLWTSTRVSASDPWAAPVKLGLEVNTAADETQPGLSANGRTLYFTRSGISDLGDILASTREDTTPARH